MIVTFHDIFQFSIHMFKTTFHPKLLESRVFPVKSRIFLSFSMFFPAKSHGNRHLPTVAATAPPGRLRPRRRRKGGPGRRGGGGESRGAGGAGGGDGAGHGAAGGKHQRIAMERW